jgi:hypothetical protein
MSLVGAALKATDKERPCDSYDDLEGWDEITAFVAMRAPCKAPQQLRAYLHLTRIAAAISSNRGYRREVRPADFL